jgi:hypothetical protein
MTRISIPSISLVPSNGNWTGTLVAGVEYMDGKPYLYAESDLLGAVICWQGLDLDQHFDRVFLCNKRDHRSIFSEVDPPPAGTTASAYLQYDVAKSAPSLAESNLPNKINPPNWRVYFHLTSIAAKFS